MSNLDAKFAELSRHNTDTYCRDMSYTAFKLAAMMYWQQYPSARSYAMVADCADRIIALRTAEQSAAQVSL